MKLVLTAKSFKELRELMIESAIELTEKAKPEPEKKAEKKGPSATSKDPNLKDL